MLHRAAPSSISGGRPAYTGELARSAGCRLCLVALDRPCYSARWMAASSVITTATAMGKLRHLVLSSHGYIRYGSGGITDSVISIGAGLSRSNIELFSRLKGSVGGGVIWFGACGSGNDNIGNGERASRAGAYIVAPVMYMQPKSGQGSKLPPGMMDMYQRFVPKVFAPTGHLVSWSSFLRMGTLLGFRVT